MSSLSLAVRTLHVLAMAVVVGGTAAVWYAYRNDVVRGPALARGFEWAFWAALGVLVLTGVGNLGSLGPPGPRTEWGRILLVKLVLVVGIVAGSAVRTLVVVRTSALASETQQRTRGTLRRAYGVTTVALLILSDESP